VKSARVQIQVNGIRAHRRIRSHGRVQPLLKLVGEQALDQVKAGGEMPRELADGHSGALGDLL
jgi:hypothetical protein